MKKKTNIICYSCMITFPSGGRLDIAIGLHWTVHNLYLILFVCEIICIWNNLYLIQLVLESICNLLGFWQTESISHPSPAVSSVGICIFICIWYSLILNLFDLIQLVFESPCKFQVFWQQTESISHPSPAVSSAWKLPSLIGPPPIEITSNCQNFPFREVVFLYVGGEVGHSPCPMTGEFGLRLFRWVSIS